MTYHSNIISFYFEVPYAEVKDNLSTCVNAIFQVPELSPAMYYAVAWINQSGTECVNVLLSLKRSLILEEDNDELVDRIAKDLHCVRINVMFNPKFSDVVDVLIKHVETYRMSNYSVVLSNISTYTPVISSVKTKETYLSKASIGYESKYIALAYKTSLGKVLYFFLTRDYPIYDFSIQMNDKRQVYVVMDYGEPKGEELCFDIGNVSPFKKEANISTAHYTNKLSAQKSISIPIRKQKPSGITISYSHSCGIDEVDDYYDTLTRGNDNMLYISLSGDSIVLGFYSP